MKALNSVFLWARVPSTTMEGGAYLNSCIFPSTIPIQPFTITPGFVILNAAVAKFLVDRCPVHVSYIIRVIF